MRDFSSFEAYLRSSEKQSKGLEEPEKLTHIPTGFVTMAEIVAYSKTLPKYTVTDYSEVRKVRENKAEAKRKMKLAMKETAEQMVN